MKRLFLCALVLGVGEIISSAQSSESTKDPKTEPYHVRLIARGFGNVGRWWSLMNEGDKSAFLDGYQEAMRKVHQQESDTCEVIRQQVVKDTKSSLENLSEVNFVCERMQESAEYERVVVKDLDNFYSDIKNQFIPIQWSMEYLRDGASNRKTEGQLLDALRKLQKEFSR